MKHNGSEYLKYINYVDAYDEVTENDIVIYYLNMKTSKMTAQNDYKP